MHSSQEATSLFRESINTVINTFEQQQKYAKRAITVGFHPLEQFAILIYMSRWFSSLARSRQMIGSGLGSSHTLRKTMSQFAVKTIICGYLPLGHAHGFADALD